MLLASNPNMPPARIERIVAGIDRQVELATNHVVNIRHIQHSRQKELELLGEVAANMQESAKALGDTI